MAAAWLAAVANDPPGRHHPPGRGDGIRQVLFGAGPGAWIGLRTGQGVGYGIGGNGTVDAAVNP